MLRRRKQRDCTATPGTGAELVFHLSRPATPDHMADHASDLVEIARRVDGVELDFSVESLVTVDALLGRFHEDGEDPADLTETMFRFGAYIGEVMVRQAGATWVTVPSHHPLGNGFPLIEVHPGALANPVGKAFKRAGNGPGESIPYFYAVFTGLPA